MQQAIYNSINSTIYNSGSTIRNSGSTANTAKDGARLAQWIARKWDMAAVVALMLSSATYGVFALAHSGL
jgi:hypothetical protein